MNVRPAPTGLSRRDTLKQAGLLAGLAALPTTLFTSRALARDAAAFADAAPTGLASQPPAFYRTKIGSLPAIVFSDGFGTLPQAYPTIAPQAGSAEALDALLTASFCPPKIANLHFNAFLIDAPSGKILVDTGYGVLGGESNAALLPNLAAAGIKPADISALILTHLHPDHAGGLMTKAGALAFPNAEVYVSKDEVDFWSGTNPDLSKSGIPEGGRPGMVKVATDSLAAVKAKLHVIPSDYKIADGVSLMPLPGHTPGHVGVSVESGNEKFLYWADVVHHFAVMIPKPDWTIGFDTDPATAVATRKAVLKMAAADRIRIAGSHLPFPAIGHVRAVGDGYQWVPEAYSWQ